MKIKSDFKDFYDYALSGIINQDNNITYVRKLEIVDIKNKATLELFPYDFKEIKTNEEKEKYALKNNIDLKTKLLKINKFYVLFCGELYYGKQYVVSENISYGYYSKEKIISIAYEYEDFNLTEKDIEFKKRLLTLSNNEPILVVKKFSNVIESKPELNYNGWLLSKKEQNKQKEIQAEKTKIVISDEINEGINYVINDSLKNVSFNKVMEAHIVYQEIEQWLAKQNSIEKEVIFSDIEKRDQHGFDKYSFKKGK